MSTPTSALQPLGIGDQELQILHSEGYTQEKLQQLAHELHQRFSGVPRDVFANKATPTLNDVLSQDHRLIPTIPEEFGFRWLLQNIAEINKYDNKAWKSNQPENIAKGIWYWRLDEEHVFHRWHDSARWNISIFLALLVEDERKINQNQQTGRLSDDAVRYMEGYLRAVLESHNEPGQFLHRDGFFCDWRSHEYDVFTADHREVRKRLRERMKTLKTELDRLHPVLSEPLGGTEYERQYGNFMGPLIPGSLPSTNVHDFTRDGNGIISSKMDARLNGIPTPDREYRMDILRILDSAAPTVSDDKLPERTPAKTVTGIWTTLDTLENVNPRGILEMVSRRFAGI